MQTLRFYIGLVWLPALAVYSALYLDGVTAFSNVCLAALMLYVLIVKRRYKSERRAPLYLQNLGWILVGVSVAAFLLAVNQRV